MICTRFLLAVAASWLFTASVSANWTANVPLLEQKHLQASYWIDRHSEPDALIMSADQIEAFNQSMVNANPYVDAPLSYPDHLSGQSLRETVNAASARPDSERFYADGTPLGENDWASLHSSLNLPAIKDRNPVTWGLVVRRAALRTFPTYQRVFNQGMDIDLDRFQESSVFPGEAVAVLHQSLDGEWVLVRNYHYTAWVEKDAIATAPREQVQQFVSAESFLLVTGAKVLTNEVPDLPSVSARQLDMGVRLPLLDHRDFGDRVHRQNPAYSHIVSFPTRDSQGKLVLKPALIATSQDVSIGLLPFTPRNLLGQAFKFLGERYGWGHDYNSRDCTGFVGDVLKTFGLIMPRNSSQQGRSDYAGLYRFDEGLSEAEDVQARLSELRAGDILYLPGHVTMVIGHDGNEPYMIHDVKGLAFYRDKIYQQSTLNGVSVTPLTPLQLNQNTRYLDRLYHVKRLGGQP